MEIRESLGNPDTLVLGIDRLDYTKGIVERFQAVERMLEQQPGMVGNFTFVQIAAPSRASLDEYQSFDARVRKMVERINRRFGSGNYGAIRYETAWAPSDLFELLLGVARSWHPYDGVRETRNGLYGSMNWRF